MRKYVVVAIFRANRMKAYFIGDIISQKEYDIIPDFIAGGTSNPDFKSVFLKEIT